MLEFEAGRHSAIRDLDAIISRLHELSPEEWDRATPDKGWTVRHLAAHLTETVPFMTNILGEIIALRIGHVPTTETGDIVTPESPTREITASLTQHRNAFYHTISAMDESDLEAVARGGKMFPRSGQLYLVLATSEFGTHRFDLQASQGEPEAGLSDEAVIANDEMMLANMALFANATGEHPEEPVSFVFSGSLFDRRLTWDGTTWTQDIEPEQSGEIHEIRFHGDDSAQVLFVFGRLGVDSDRLRIGDGSKRDHDAAARFKTYIPGP